MYKIIGADQKEYGPVPLDLLQQWIGQGRLNSETLVQIEGATEWKPLREFPELAAFLPAAAPPSAPLFAAGSAEAGGKPKTSRMAITSLVLGVLGLVSCGLTALPGLILGIVSLLKINKSQGQLGGSGLAIAGICVSGAFLVLVPIQLGMLLPALAKAKGKAQEIKCLNNLKQLSLGLRIYATDHDDKMPAANAWCDAIAPVVGDDRAFQCPAQAVNRCSYAMNAKLSELAEGELKPNTVMLFESNGGWNSSGGPADAVKRHTRYLVGFADGSVRMVNDAEFANLNWDP